MKLLALLSSAAIVVAAVARQETQTFPEPLASDLTKLSTAKSLKVHFTKRVVGEAATDYTLELSKDKKFKLTYDGGFVLSDGTNIYVYKKSDKSYTQSELTDKDLKKFTSRVELVGWEAFLQKKPGSDIASAQKGANHTLKDVDYATVDLIFKPDNRLATLFIDPMLGIAKGFSVKVKDKEYLVLADTISITDEPLPDSEFAFVAPEGATLAKAAEEGTFASVQAIMTDNCLPCHSSENHRAGVDITTYAGIVATVTAGQSSASLLVKALKGDGVDLMPKGRAPVSDDKIASVAKWIDAGAKNE